MGETLKRNQDTNERIEIGDESTRASLLDLKNTIEIPPTAELISGPYNEKSELILKPGEDKILAGRRNGRGTNKR